MKTEINREGSTLTITLTGRLDTLTAPELEAKLKEELTGIDEIICDFAGLEYISSAGLRVLLMAKRTIGGNVTVKNANELIKEVFDVTGFSGILTVE